VHTTTRSQALAWERKDFAAPAALKRNEIDESQCRAGGRAWADKTFLRHAASAVAHFVLFRDCDRRASRNAAWRFEGSVFDKCF
jgi:hypothetical protein